MTAFKRTAFVAAALRSVLDQSFEDYEIILADDSNSDAIRNLMLDQADERIRYNPSVPHKGVARCIADSIRISRGTYIAILNDDDLWEPNFLEALLLPLENDGTCVLAFSDHWIMDEDGTVDWQDTETNSRKWGRSDLQGGRVADVGRVVVLNKTVPMVMGSLFRKAALNPDQITDHVGGAYDYWLSVLLAATGAPLHYVPLRLTRYRVHRQMETFRPSPTKQDDELYIVSQIIARGWFKEIDQGVRARFTALSGAVAINKLRFRQAATARSIAWAGLRSSFSWRCLAVFAASLSPALPHRLLFERDRSG